MTTPEPDTPVGRTEPLAIEDFRSLRRWLVVLGLVAAIAIAVAAYALIAAGDSAGDDDVSALADRLSKTERQLGETSESDVRDVERRLRRTGEESDIRVLDERITRLENDVVETLDASVDRGRELNRLTQRVEALSREVRRLREEADEK